MNEMRLVVAGAAGRMGRVLVEIIRQTPGAHLAGAIEQPDSIAIGQDAGTLTEAPGTTGASGGFGEQADAIVINNLRQHTWLTTAGTFTLPNLSLGCGGSC